MDPPGFLPDRPVELVRKIGPGRHQFTSIVAQAQECAPTAVTRQDQAKLVVLCQGFGSKRPGLSLGAAQCGKFAQSGARKAAPHSCRGQRRP